MRFGLVLLSLHMKLTPIARRVLVPRQRKFYEDLAVINGCLDDLISRAKDTRQAKDIEALQSRDYSKVRATDLPTTWGRC